MGFAVEKDNNNPYIDHSSMQQQKKEAMKQISVSEKRQITIPKQFYDASGMGTEVVCELRGDEIVLRALPPTEDFSEEILKDLVAQGLTGEKLVREFQRQKANIRPAVEELMKASHMAAHNLEDDGDKETDELFGDLKEE